MHIIKTILILFIISSSTFGQIKDTLYSLSTEIGLGYSRYFTTVDYDDLNKHGFTGTVRVMWNPEHLLSVGLETGYQYLYSIDLNDYSTEFGTTDFSASLYTVPIFMVFTMKVAPNIKLTTGSGMYLLYNAGNLFNHQLESNQLSIGVYGGISYTYPIYNDISLGAELQYAYFSKIQDQTLSLKFVFIYDFIKW